MARIKNPFTGARTGGGKVRGPKAKTVPMLAKVGGKRLLNSKSGRKNSG